MRKERRTEGQNTRYRKREREREKEREIYVGDTDKV